MKKIIILSLALFAVFATGNAQKKTASKRVSTQSVESSPKEEVIYYDENWKGVQSEEFASFIRHAYYSSDPHYPNRFKNTYKTGELQGEGTFIAVDKYDDAKTVYISGKSFYKSGSLMLEFSEENGKRKYVSYEENGFKLAEYETVKGKIEGLVKQYAPFESGCIEQYYVNGAIDVSKPYFYAKGKNGSVVKHDINTGKKIDLETPSSNDIVMELHDGKKWSTIRKNGIEVSTSADIFKDYGGKNGIMTGMIKMAFGNKGLKTYTRVMVLIKNNSATPLMFDPSLIKATEISKKKPQDIEFISFVEYSKSMDNAQRNQSMFNAAGEQQLARDMATTSRSVSNTNAASAYSSNSSAQGSVNGKSVAVGAAAGNGWGAVGASASSVNGSYSAQSNTSGASVYRSQSASETLDAGVYYQGMQDARANIEKFDGQLEAEREKKRDNYLKPCEIPPFGTYMGYIYSNNLKLAKIEYDINLEGQIYPMIFAVSDSRDQ